MARIQGLERLNAKLKALRTDTAEAVEPAMARAAEVVVDQQKHLAPVKTGALRDSITYTFGEPPEGARLGAGRATSENPTRVFITAGNRDVFYAPFVEFGTTSMQAQAFFYPGYRAAKKRAQAIISRAVGQAVKKAAAT